MCKTNHLKNSEVLFPTKILLDLWATSSQGIVQVHGNVYEAVDHGSKKSCMCLVAKKRQNN